MNMPGLQCPCESVRELQDEVKKHRTELAKGDIRFLVIDTELLIMRYNCYNIYITVIKGAELY